MVDNVDRIVALQNGVIVEEGALDVLIQKKVIYSEFRRLQMVRGEHDWGGLRKYYCL